jgi:Ca-activated chloride channel family protein
MFNRLALFALIVTSVGCNYSLGITPGGSQDIGYARDLIANGQVPPADTITVGGLLNEHDLPLETEDCAQLLCITGTAGIGQVDVEGADSVFLQIGYDSDLTADTFQRQPQTIIAVVDISGSMGDAVEEIQHSLEELVDSLDQDDALGVVTYGSIAKTLLPVTPVSDKQKILRKLGKLKTGGSTNMESGMKLGYKLAKADHSGNQKRVMLFTDVQPNVGNTDSGDFLQIVTDGIDHEIGLTLFGIGRQFGYGLALEISEVPLANYFYLANSNDIESVFADFDYMVTPVARDVTISVSAADNLELVEAYNVQSSKDNGQLIETYVATLFLSSDNGASIIRLGGGENGLPALDADIATLDLSYVDLMLEPGTIVDFEVSVQLSDEAGGYGQDGFGHISGRKGAVLVNMGLAMIDLCEAWAMEDVALSLDAYESSLARLTAEAESLDDDDLRAEVQLMTKLLENVTQRISIE